MGNANLLFYDNERLRQRYTLATFYFSTEGVSWRQNTATLDDLPGDLPDVLVTNNVVSTHIICGSDGDGVDGGGATTPWTQQTSENAVVVPNTFCGSNAWTQHDSWLSDEDECTWFSWSDEPCNMGKFAQLVLYYNNLAGSLPPELGLLSDNLETIHLNGGPHRAIGGSIPVELGHLSRLKEFRLANNVFTGSVPIEFGTLTSLELLDLSNNQLSSSLSTTIGQWVKLKELNLSRNQFSGTIPDEIGQATSLTRFIADGNMLSGPLPSEIGNLRKLKTLSFANNQITHIPPEIGSLGELEFLSGAINKLSGPLPSEVGSLLRLRSLNLAQNSLSGPIPDELSQLKSLVDTLDLSFNQFTGPIPTTMGNINGLLRVLSLRSNSLSGQVPESFAFFQQLVTLYLDDNELTGTMPTSVCEVFNETLPSDSVSCPCCNYCCSGECECRYTGTDEDWKCY
jgi:Leucine-rich repeat (LRR) protein